MVQNLKWATAHLSRRLGARHSDTARRRAGGARGTQVGAGLGAQVGAGRACVLGVQGTCAAGCAGRWGAQGERARGALAGARARAERRRQRALQEQAWARGALGVSVRSAWHGRAGRAAWACVTHLLFTRVRRLGTR